MSCPDCCLLFRSCLPPFFSDDTSSQPCTKMVFLNVPAIICLQDTLVKGRPSAASTKENLSLMLAMYLCSFFHQIITFQHGTLKSCRAIDNSMYGLSISQTPQRSSRKSIPAIWYSFTSVYLNSQNVFMYSGRLSSFRNSTYWKAENHVLHVRLVSFRTNLSSCSNILSNCINQISSTIENHFPCIIWPKALYKFVAIKYNEAKKICIKYLSNKVL